jgi:hypothetical protein
VSLGVPIRSAVVAVIGPPSRGRIHRNIGGRRREGSDLDLEARNPDFT